MYVNELQKVFFMKLRPLAIKLYNVPRRYSLDSFTVPTGLVKKYK